MTVLGDIVRLPRGSSVTTIVHDREAPVFGEEIASVHVLALPDDQHAAVELSFLDSHMPYSLGGFAGALSDGRPWALLLQHAPLHGSAAAGQPDPRWLLRDSLARALRFNRGAREIAGATYGRDELLEAYRGAGVPRRRVMGWTVPDLLRGLMAEACGAPLGVVVDGYDGGCALAAFEHECAGDVFTDVFRAKQESTLPVTGHGLWDEQDDPTGSSEMPTKDDLRQLRRSTLVLLARSYRVPKPTKLSRRGLVRSIRRAAVLEGRRGVRRPRGDEHRLTVRQFESFVGVDPGWLLPRLRLDPASSPVDYMGEAVIITVEDESYWLSADEVCGDEPGGRLIDACAADCSWVGFADRHGEWVRSFVTEEDDHLVWTGSREQDDGRELALDWLGDLVLDHEFDRGVPIELWCGWLDEDDPDDRREVHDIVGGRVPVILNGTELTD
jgi:hypothetical protein